MEELQNRPRKLREGHDFSRAVKASKTNSALAAEGSLPRIAAIGPATKKAIEQRGMKVDVVPKEYVAESVVKSLKSKVKGKRVLLVRAKVARDVIPTELRKAGAHVDVVEAYETVVPQVFSRSPARCPEESKETPARSHVHQFLDGQEFRGTAGRKQESSADKESR